MSLKCTVIMEGPDCLCPCGWAGTTREVVVVVSLSRTISVSRLTKSLLKILTNCIGEVYFFQCQRSVEHHCPGWSLRAERIWVRTQSTPPKCLKLASRLVKLHSIRSLSIAAAGLELWTAEGLNGL